MSAWAERPLPFPAKGPDVSRCWNGFYSPELNAHFFHVAGDSRDDGTVWAYLYKRAPDKKRDGHEPNASQHRRNRQSPGGARRQPHRAGLGRPGRAVARIVLTNSSDKTPSGTPAVAGGGYRTRGGTPFRV